MRKFILAIVCLFISANVSHAAFGIFQTALAAPTADWIRDVTAAPYSAACNGVADDRAVFASFLTDAQAQSALGNSVMMVIPSGKTCVVSSGTTTIGKGVKNFTLYGYGASLSNGGTGTLLFGGEGQIGGLNGNKFSARLASANAGDTCVNLLYPTPSPAITVSNIVSTGSTWRLTISDSTSFTTGQILRVSDVTASNKGTLEGLQFVTVVASGTIDVQTPSLFLGTFAYTSGGKINDYTALFAVDQWVLLGGLDVQAIYRSGGFGQPSNPASYEYIKIQSINLSTGQICFYTPLANSYKSTWPNYDVGGRFGPDTGGGATLWSLDSTWDSNLKIYGITLNSPSGQQRMLGRSVYVQDMTDTSAPSSFASQTGSFVGVNSSFSGNYEIDKINGPFSCTGCSFNILHVQSRSSSTLMTLTNSTINQLNGTPASIVMSNTSVATQMQIAPSGYGTSSSFVGSSVTSPSLSYISTGANPSGGLQIEPGYSISGDTISIVQATVTSAPPWAVEGSYICWYSNFECEDIAKIVAVGESPLGTTTVKLNKSYSGSTWPAVIGGTVKLRAHPMPAYTCATCSGNNAMVGMAGGPAGVPIYSYWSRAYSGTIGGTAQTPFVLWGKIQSLSMNVTNAGGANLFGLSQFNNWNMLSPAFTSISGGWNSSGGGPVVNTNLAGDRTLTLSGTYSVSGTQSGDTGWTTGAIPNSTFMWFPKASNSGPIYNSAPVGCPGAGCPSVTVTIQTDQGVVP